MFPYYIYLILQIFLYIEDIFHTCPKKYTGWFLASPDAQEVIVVSESLSHWSELADLTDVTLVSDDTFRRLGT